MAPTLARRGSSAWVERYRRFACVQVQSVDERHEGVRSNGLEPESEPDEGSVGWELVRVPGGWKLVLFEEG